MTTNDKQHYNILLKREIKRKKQVKEYFARRKLKESFYKKFFIENANDEQKTELKNLVENL